MIPPGRPVRTRRTMMLTAIGVLCALLVELPRGAAGQEEPLHDDETPLQAATQKKHPGVILAEAQVEWLRSHGGFYNDKISIRPLFESDSATVPLGLFANKAVQKGETLMLIPRTCLLGTGSSYSEDMCDTALNLVRQRKLQDRSLYEPYVSYMYSKTRVQLPSNWSPAAQNLLLQIRGNYLPPDDLTEVSFANHCEHRYEDVEEKEYDWQEVEFAYLTVVSRAWSQLLVPVFDMINHHSGRYANVDSTSIQDVTVDKITAYATRNIAAGEQLFLSYMDCIDERGFELEYVLPQLLRDFGYVDDYPQRWTFPTPINSKSQKKARRNDNLVFEIDFRNEQDDALYKAGALQSLPEMKITWLTGAPSEHQILFLKHEAHRLKILQPHVIAAAQQLTDDYERKVALDYYNSLSVALHYATGNVTRQNEGSCDDNDISSSLRDAAVCGIVNGEDVVTSKMTSTSNHDHDDIDEYHVQPVTNIGQGNNPDDWMACDDHWKIQDDYTPIDHLSSWYQTSNFFYHEEDDDVCLYMDGYLHACASSRPHYHEVFVHYAARFLDQVQRVLFIGGGDSMVLHEVLKYPELELVVGLELDQRVVRSSFKNFGTQPHWDNDKVKWYFGDAAKSLLVLPRDYYGSFDLVIVDILTEVAENLQVNEELKVIQAAMLLLKPGGIIVKNEDQGYVPGTNSDYTKYTLDLIFHDVPKYCLQVFVVGSNTVDFLTATPKDHNVETLYLRGNDDFQAQFDSWYNYGGSSSEAKDFCKEHHEEDTVEEDQMWPGVFMALEVENIAIPLQSMDSVLAGIRQALSKVGFSELQYVTHPYSSKGFSLTVLAQEGFIVARCNPKLRYCGFDIQLYGAAIEKLDELKMEVVGALQSSQSSSYRFVTLGMFGRLQEGKIGPPSATKLCSEGGDPDAPLPTRVRKERSPVDFGKPQPATLHDYSQTLPIDQWQSQRPAGIQVLLMTEVPVFWVGEHVLVDHMGTFLPGIVVRIGDDINYAIEYDGKPGILEIVEEDRITRSDGPFDFRFVSTYLTKSLTYVLAAAGQKLEPGNFVQKELPGVGEGLVVAFSWQGGTAVATWDGFAGISFNIFFASVGANIGETVNQAFEEDTLLLTLEIFPRGTGNVVNFSGEIRYFKPVWA